MAFERFGPHTATTLSGSTRSASPLAARRLLFDIAAWYWPLAADWCWTCGADSWCTKMLTISAVHAYNVHTGSYVHAHYMGI